MKTQFYDLSSEVLDDGTIRLEQRDCGESVILDLHPQQIIHIANGLTANTHQVQPNGTAKGIATLERRLLWMRNRFDECHAALPSDMYERCSEAPEFYAWLDASITVAGEFCADFPNAPSNATSKPQEATSLSPGGGCLPGVTGSDSVHPEQPSGDLFSDRAGGKQDGS